MKRKDKKLIRNLAKKHYRDGKSMQETFDLISVKVKQPLTEIADVIRFYPSPNLYEKHKKKIFLLFYSIMATELLILIAAIVFYFFGPLDSEIDFLFSGYGIFFHKGYNYIYGAITFSVMPDGVNQLGLIFLLIMILLTILPIVVWLLAILHIIKGHLEKKLEYIKMIIPYYWYTVIFYLIVSMISLIPLLENFHILTLIFFLVTLLLAVPNFLILRLAIKVRNNVTPKYKKIRVAIPGTSSKRKTRLGIIFNHQPPSN
jgi:hypothetical protein